MKLEKWSDAVHKKSEPRPPLYLFHEIADMFGLGRDNLLTMVQAASRRGEWVPPFVMQVRPTATGSKRNYYRKADFVKFLEKDKQ
jgi:hypothetical protein